MEYIITVYFKGEGFDTKTFTFRRTYFSLDSYNETLNFTNSEFITIGDITLRKNDLIRIEVEKEQMEDAEADTI